MEGTARIWFTSQQRAELWGALEERSMCGGYRSGACEEEQERCLAYPGSQWWHCSGAAPESCGSAEP